MRIAIIPARGGSTRIPRKNVKDFFGQPIISYSIEKAQASGLFDKIIISTDDDEIELIAKRWGADVWRRNPKFGNNEVGTQAVMRECLLGVGTKPDDIVCCIYATAPLLDVADLIKGYEVLTAQKHSGTTFVFSVGYPPLQDAGQFYWGYSSYFTNPEPLVSTHTRVINLPEDRVCDINTPEDWAKAETMFNALETKTRE